MSTPDIARVGLLVPMRVELAPIVRRLHLRPVGDGPGRRWEARHGDRDIVAVLAGVGPAASSAAAEDLIARHRPDLVVLAGVAGAVDPGLGIGEVVVPGWAVDATSGSVHAAAPLPGVATDASGVVTTDGWLDPTSILRFAADGAVIVDMETAAVAAVCERHGVGWSAVRAVSDRLADGVVDEAIAQLVGADGRADLRAVALHLVPRVWRLAPLLRVARDSSRATRALADAVVPALVG